MAGPKKPRLSLHQMVFFSVGHVMNDLFNTIYASYLLTFQTKVLDLPSTIVGLLWLIPTGIDAILALLIGHVSDNVSVPFLSRHYGKRKTWHLFGCTLVGVCSPFLLMPCFLCGEDTIGWKIVLYYVPILVLAYAGWGLTQSNFLALIPVIAKRQSEMVKLGAINSAITLTCGMFVYIVTWVLLGSDSSQTLSFSQWKKFMYLVVIVVGTGAFFSSLFHFGTREPSTDAKNLKSLTNNSDSIYVNKFSNEANFDETSSHVIDKKSVAPAHNVCDVIQGWNDTAIVNPSFEDDEKKPSNQGKEVAQLDVETLEEVLWAALSEKSKEQNDEDASSIESSGYGDDWNAETTSEEASDVELPMPETFMDMVPNVSELMLHSHRTSARTSPFPSPRLSRAASRRHMTGSLAMESHHNESLYNVMLRSRLNSSCSRVSPLPTPSLCRSTSHRINALDTNSLHHHKTSFPCENIKTTLVPSPLVQPRTTMDVKQDNYYDEFNEISIKTRNSQQQCPSVINNTIEKKDDIIIINDRTKKQTDSVQSKSSWRTLFKNPEFYKLGAAYMFTRVSQNVTTSYLPLFLTDHLKFGKESIAYFPLVILFSGVFASFAAKRLNKVLGNKWTFCLGSILVMGASGWFYLLTPENRSAMYVPAIFTGCGSSIMFVTSLALAADFVDTDKSSGAFMIASMSLLCKIVMGVLFCLLQEFSPIATGSDCPECISYIRHVFCLTPGVSALFGLISFILFIPATIQCKPIAHTADAETQTEVLQPHEELHPHSPLEIIIENETESSKITIDAETQTDKQPFYSFSNNENDVSQDTVKMESNESPDVYNTRM